MIMKRINLGCGSDVRDGYENYDMNPVDDRVKLIDLNKLPLPFDDSSVDEIILSHIIEHLDVNPYYFIKDVYRILKKDGVVKISLPVLYNSIVHNRCYHNSGYFDSLMSKDNRVSNEYERDFFELISFKKKPFGLKNGLKKLIAFVMDLFYEEYSWELKKK